MANRATKRRALAEREAEQFTSQASHYPRRSKAVTPDWEELKSMTFTEYVQHALFDDEDDSGSSSEEEERNNGSEKKEMPPRKVSWNHGVVKITLPKGWWDEAGIAKDRTARGPEWQDGTKLGDLMVEGPIKQHISGIGGIYEYALFDSPAMKLSDFRAKGDDYRKNQVGSVVDDKFEDDDVCDGLARRFWRRLGPTTPPSMYGADMEGSLFDGDPATGWSLEGLDNCLHLLSADQDSKEMPGVTTPYLYFGMWGSVFCAHTEDMNLLSINYLHAGAPKYWYAIAPEHAKRFESLAESHFVHAARDCPEFLRHKQNMLSPAILKKAGVPFEVQIQRPGDAMITCPGAYHFGVNLGFNVAEATNFAIPEWIPKGKEAKVCMCRPQAVRIDVDRFAGLLEKYEHDMENANKLGFPRLSYRRWTLLEDSRRHQAEKAAESKTSISPKKKKRKKLKEESPTKTTTSSEGNELWVEVMIPLGADGKSARVTKANKRRKKTKASKEGHQEEWRLAKRIDAKKRKTAIKLDTKVLCLLPGRTEGADVEDEQCFAGAVTEIADGHVRIHFAGLKKEDDVWMQVSSPKLFLDGGKWEASKHDKLVVVE